MKGMKSGKKCVWMKKSYGWMDECCDDNPLMQMF